MRNPTSVQPLTKVRALQQVRPSPTDVKLIVNGPHRMALILLLPIGFYMAFFPLFRPLGEWVLGVTLMFCLLSAIAAGKLHLPIGLGFLFFVSLPILLLSLNSTMPQAWTRYYSDFAAFRHWSWVVIIIIVINNSRFFWYKSYSFVQENAWKCAAAYYIVTRLGILATGEIGLIDITLYHVSVTTTPIVIFLAVGLLSSTRPSWQNLAIFAILVPLMTSQTHLLSWITCYFCLIMPRRMTRFAPTLIGLALIIFLVTAPHFSRMLHEIDGNTGVRSVLWGHVQTAVFQTYGLGVGFGTEYFPNDFRQIVSGSWQLTGEKADDRLYVSTHSAFYDTVFRMGILGLVGLIVWFSKYIRTPINMSNQSHIPLTSGLVSMLLFITAFNPGLVSVYILIVIAFIIGLVDILAFRASAPAARREAGIER